jgi:hypothetical protein
VFETKKNNNNRGQTGVIHADRYNPRIKLPIANTNVMATNLKIKFFIEKLMVF